MYVTVQFEDHFVAFILAYFLFESKYVDVRFAIMTQHQSIPIGDTVQNPCSTISYTSDSSGLEINMKLWIGLVGIYNSE